VPAFFRHVLERVDWRTDLHFQTCTTIDTLDYSGTGLNEGSKLVIAAAGPRRRGLPSEIPGNVILPDGFDSPRVCMPGVIAVNGPPARGKRPSEFEREMEQFVGGMAPNAEFNAFPLVIVADDSEFVSRSLESFLWVVFTRSDPAADIYGVGAVTRKKHWGCEGTLVIDARIKRHHAPPLEEDPTVSKRVDSLAAPGGPLNGLF